MGNTYTAERVLTESKADLHGKVAIVTGASAGIGKEAARVLMKGGARVILACRGKEKAEKVAKDIRASVKDEKAGSVEVMELDVSDLDSVRSFAKNFLELKSQLHLLICNAGVMLPVFGKSKQGYESAFATNHLGHFLLVGLLSETLKASAPARVVVVSSALHSGAMYWDGFLADGKGWSSMNSYNQSKLANILFAKELDARLAAEAKGKGSSARVTAHSLHPGVIKTEITRDMGTGVSIFLTLGKPFLKTIPQGAATTLYCAVAPPLEKTGGKYFADCAEKQPKPYARDPENARKLWEASEKLVGFTYLSTPVTSGTTSETAPKTSDEVPVSDDAPVSEPTTSDEAPVSDDAPVSDEVAED